MFSFNPKVSTLLRLQLLNSPPKPTRSAKSVRFVIISKTSCFCSSPSVSFLLIVCSLLKNGVQTAGGGHCCCAHIQKKQLCETNVWSSFFGVPYQWHWVHLSADTRSTAGWNLGQCCWTICSRNIHLLKAKHKNNQQLWRLCWVSQWWPLIMRATRLIKQLLSCGCIIGCWHIIWPCRLKRVQFNVLIFSKSFCLMTFYQCYYDFINISISAVNDCISLRSPV